MLADHAVIDQRLRLPDVTLVCVDTANPKLALYAVARSMAWIDFGAALLITRPDHGLSDFPAGLQVITNETIRSSPDYSRFMLRGLSPLVQTSHCLVVQWDGFVLDPSMWSDDFLRFDYIGPVWERFRNDERCCCTGGFSLRSSRLLAALLDERIESQQPEDVCIALEYREYLERHHDIRYPDKQTACRFAIEDLYVSPSAFGFHGVHNLLCVLAPEEFEDFMVHAPDSVFASFRMRRFIKHATSQSEIDLAHRALLRRRSSRKLDMSDVRLWWRLYRARLSMLLMRSVKASIRMAGPRPTGDSRPREESRSTNSWRLSDGDAARKATYSGGILRHLATTDGESGQGRSALHLQDLRSVSADAPATIEEACDRRGHTRTETTQRRHWRAPTKAKPAK